jgi:hypothetical protein
MAQHRENLLASRQVETAGDGWHSDGKNLFLRVDGDRRRWIVRVTRAGRKRDFGVGSVKTTLLKLGRKKRDAILAQLADGLDPVAIDAIIKSRRSRCSSGLFDMTGVLTV